MSLFYLPTPWVIDVWDCHGVLKRREWGVGYGCKPQLPDGLEWLEVGSFSIPIKSDEKAIWNDRVKRKLNNLLFAILEENDGAINWSGIYPVYAHQFDAIVETVVKYGGRRRRPEPLSLLFGR